MENKSINSEISERKNIDEDYSVVKEYLDVVKSEYDIERDKKQSFENRAGIILAMLGAICIFLFEQVKFIDILELLTVDLNFVILVKILTGFFVYLAFVLTVITVVLTIVAKKHHNFEVKNIDESLVFEDKAIAFSRITFTYRDIILQHREINEKRAKNFKLSIYGMLVTLFSTLIYISIIL